MIDIVSKIRDNQIDINNHQNFFSILIKGLLLNLGKDVSVRGIPVPHIILHTGDDTMYIENKNENYSAASLDITNENYIYNIVPRCNVALGGIDFLSDQLTSPTAMGNAQIELDDMIYSVTGEMKRLPLKMGVELTYYLDTFQDMLELVQHIATRLAFIRNYKIVYLGQVINCSYKIPESFNGEWMPDLDGATQDERNRKVTLSLEVESNIPFYNPATIMDSTHTISNNEIGILIHKTNGIQENSTYEKVDWRDS